ncbi:hypothetical protein FOXB_03233 [Fusarium oxysporum f. sp. conglutinans Fo5176]|uniref:Uncharacterized protein n=1 Tax=Fusarium oxysporum (strain Fo5176) TaxID=660025 RepID=F9FA08_FUSOF|nr:hypothetical protein FOXB_03233 [Fusarium oxysporum f. sp. conglutinans Fo5176]
MSHELQSDVIGDNLLEKASTSFVRLSIRYAKAQPLDLRNLSLPLLFTVQSHTASGFLFTNTGHGTLRSDLLKPISATASDDFDFDRVKPLLKSALAIEPDALIGIEPMTLSPNPPRLPDRQLLPSNRPHGCAIQAAFANSSKHRRYVDDVLKTEPGSMYAGLRRSHDAYFGALMKVTRPTYLSHKIIPSVQVQGTG